MGQVRKLNENSSRRYQFYDRRIKNLLRKIHADSREKPEKNTSEVSCFDVTLYDMGKQFTSISTVYMGINRVSVVPCRSVER